MQDTSVTNGWQCRLRSQALIHGESAHSTDMDRLLVMGQSDSKSGKEKDSFSESLLSSTLKNAVERSWLLLTRRPLLNSNHGHHAHSFSLILVSNEFYICCWAFGGGFLGKSPSAFSQEAEEKDTPRSNALGYQNQQNMREFRVPPRTSTVPTGANSSFSLTVPQLQTEED